MLAACSSVKSYELGLRGSAGLNPNEDDQPNPVQIDSPCRMTETYLTSRRRLVIEERAADPAPQA